MRNTDKYVMIRPALLASSASPALAAPIADTPVEDFVHDDSVFTSPLRLGGKMRGTPATSSPSEDVVRQGQVRIDVDDQHRDSPMDSFQMPEVISKPYGSIFLSMTDKFLLMPGLNLVFAGWGSGKTTLVRHLATALGSRATLLSTGEPINPLEFMYRQKEDGSEDTSPVTSPWNMNSISMDDVATKGAQSLYEGLVIWGGRTQFLLIDGLRDILFSDGSALSTGGTNAYLHQELMALSNMFVRSGVTAVAVLNPDRSDERFVETLRATLSGSVTQLITLSGFRNNNLEGVTTSRIERAERPFSLPIGDTQPVQDRISALVQGIATEVRPEGGPTKSVSAEIPAARSPHFMVMN